MSYVPTYPVPIETGESGDTPQSWQEAFAKAKSEKAEVWPTTKDGALSIDND